MNRFIAVAPGPRGGLKPQTLLGVELLTYGAATGFALWLRFSVLA